MTSSVDVAEYSVPDGVEVEDTIQALITACENSHGKELVLQENEAWKFKLLLKEEEAHHGIRNVPHLSENNGFKNQVTIVGRKSRETLFFTIFTPEPLSIENG